MDNLNATGKRIPCVMTVSFRRPKDIFQLECFLKNPYDISPTIIELNLCEIWYLQVCFTNLRINSGHR